MEERTERRKDAEDLLLPVPDRLCLLDSAERPSPLCRCTIQKAAAVLFKILGKFSLFIFFLLPFICVVDFKLYLFIMAVCMLKELLQEYLKRQEHLPFRVAIVAIHNNIR